MKAFQAYAKNYSKSVEKTPAEAAVKFFEENPTARKCNVTEGQIEVTDGHEFFVTRFGNRFSTGGMPQTWTDVTKMTAATLVDAKAAPEQKS